MWAGGELEWVQGNELRVGEEVTETTELRSAVAKRTKAGEEMIVVGVEKRFENERGVAVVDRR
jgi:hydroxyacyl-ACP dehydratase HTD2-like protein with hotdog domain